MSIDIDSFNGGIGAHVYGANMLAVTAEEAQRLITQGAHVVPTLAVQAGFSRILRLGEQWYAERENSETTHG